jgi:hypothetical protein
MYAILDRATGNFIHDTSQFPMLFYDPARAKGEFVRLRRAGAPMSTIEVVRVRLVEEL